MACRAAGQRGSAGTARHTPTSSTAAARWRRQQRRPAHRDRGGRRVTGVTLLQRRLELPHRGAGPQRETKVLGGRAPRILNGQHQITICHGARVQGAEQTLPGAAEAGEQEPCWARRPFGRSEPCPACWAGAISAFLHRLGPLRSLFRLCERAFPHAPSPEPLCLISGAQATPIAVLKRHRSTASRGAPVLRGSKTRSPLLQQGGVGSAAGSTQSFDPR